MRFFLSSAFFFSLGLSLVSGQALQGLDSILNFGSTDELTPRRDSARMLNTSGAYVAIDELVLFSLYGQKPFRVVDSSMNLAPGQRASFAIDFLPQHNVEHRQVLILKTSSGLGHTAVALRGQGTYSDNYYSSTQNLSEEALKTALKARLAQGYNALSYSGARDNMYASIDNSGGQVECIYTGRTASFNTRSGANANSFNTEHLFPQGFFSQNLPMRSDIHHLYPSDVTANSRRGNDPFGLVSGSSTWSQGGSKSNGSRFEPRDVSKGKVARAMMYFVLRYQDYANHFGPQENLLRQWHENYPPTAADRARNQAIYAVQNNKNPFIDYPQLAERISLIAGNSNPPARSELYRSDDSIVLASGGTGSRLFQYVLYNSGETTLLLSQFQLSDPALQFGAGSGSDFALAPGQYRYLHIAFDPSQNYQAQLSFRYGSSAGIQTVNTPIVTGAAHLTLAEAQAKPQPYPNPVQDYLHLQEGQNYRRIEIISAAGQVYRLAPADRISLAHLPAGLYLLRTQQRDGSQQDYRLIKN